MHNASFHLNEKIRKINLFVSKFLDTSYFAILLGIVALISYFLALDLVIISLISISISLALVFKKNLSCLVTIFLFMASMISAKNSPASILTDGNTGYFFNPSIYVFCIIAASIPVFICFAQCAKNIIKKKLPNKVMLISTVLFGCSLLTNGFLSKGYVTSNFLFGLFMFFFFCVLFLAIYPRISITEQSTMLLCRQVAIYVIFVLIECFYFYISNINSGIERLSLLSLGWGNSNTVGMLILICMPFLFKLFFDEKYGFKILSICLILLSIVLIVFLLSVQTYVGLAFAVLFSLLLNLIISKKKKQSVFLLVTFSALLIIFLLIYILLNPLNKETIETISNGRLDLWRKAISSFKDNIIFGGGFYFIGNDPNINLGSFVPFCCHNTLLQMLGSCGLIGFISYCFYRIISFKEIFNSFDKNKVVYLIPFFALLVMSLVDIHLFDFFGTAIYCILLILCISKKSDENDGLEPFEDKIMKEEILCL